jgi:4-hydroxybenzoyl-CoA thioesterase
MPSAENEFPSITGRFACEVQWGDCDPAGIIFYPTYFRWFDAASWALFASVGFTAARLRTEGRAMPLVGAESQFMHPAGQADRCEVRSRIARFGGKSFVVAHEVVRSDGMLMAKGAETRVWGRFLEGPGSPMKGEIIGDELKALFRTK